MPLITEEHETVQQAAAIAVILPVWNGMRDLPACLAALERQQGIDFDAYVVDNASTDGSADFVASHYPSVHLIRSDTNLGFTRGCNLGLAVAKDHAVLVLLNQDTEVRPDWLARLTAPMQHDASIGIAGSKALFADGTIQHAGGELNSQGITRHFGYRRPDRGQFDFLREVDFVTGAALAITRSAYTAIGDLDERFAPAYYEDVDWCWRARQAGFRVVYVPDSVLIHKEASVLLDKGYDAELTVHRNRLRFVLKHWSLHQLVDEFMPAEQRWLNSLGWQGERIIAALHRAYLDQLLHLSDIVEARQQAFPGSAEEIDGLAAVLLGLRAVYPLRPANLDNAEPPPAGAPQVTASPGLAASLRQRYPWLSLAGLLSPLTRPLARLSNQQQLAEVLVEYIRENNREIAELAREVDALKRHLPQDRNKDS